MPKKMRRRISFVGTSPDTRCKDFIESIHLRILGRRQKANKTNPELQQSQVLASRFRQRCHKRRADKFIVQHPKPKSRNPETRILSPGSIRTSASLAEEQNAHFQARTWFQRQVLDIGLRYMTAKMCHDELERITDAQQKIEVLE